MVPVYVFCGWKKIAEDEFPPNVLIIQSNTLLINLIYDSVLKGIVTVLPVITMYEHFIGIINVTMKSILRTTVRVTTKQDGHNKTSE